MKTRWILLSTFYNQNNAIKKEDIQLFVMTELSEYKNNKTNIPFFLSLSQIKLTPCVNANILYKHKMRTDILMQLILIKPFNKTNDKPSEFDIGIGIQQDIASLFSIYVVLAFPRHPSLSIGITRNIFLEFDIGLALQLNKNANNSKTQTKENSTNKGVEDQTIYNEYDYHQIPIHMKITQNTKPTPSYMKPTKSSQAKQNIENPTNTQSKKTTYNNNYLATTKNAINQPINNHVTKIKSIPHVQSKQNSIPSSLSRLNIKQTRTRSISPNKTRTLNHPITQSNSSPLYSTNSPRRPIKTNISISPTIYHSRKSSFQSLASNQSQHSLYNTSFGQPILNHSRTNSNISRRYLTPPRSPKQSYTPQSPQRTLSENSRYNLKHENARKNSLSNITLSSLSSPANTNETHITNIIPKKKKIIKKNPQDIMRDPDTINLVDQLLYKINIKPQSRHSTDIYTCDQCSSKPNKYTIQELRIFRRNELNKLSNALNNAKINELLSTLPIPSPTTTKKKDYTYKVYQQMQEDLSTNLTQYNRKKWQKILTYLQTNQFFHKK